VSDCNPQVVVIVTHSGFARSLLLAVEREPYRPANAELVPVIVDRNGGRDDVTSRDDDVIAASRR
jgi:hypothetical protein